jgi:hypothetical protein
MRTSLYALALAMFLPGTAATAACWNADEAGVQGPAVEICYQGSCERTYMALECAGGGGASIGYANGWAINSEITGNNVIQTVSFNERALTADQLKMLSCRDLDGDYGCRFPEATIASTGGNRNDPMSLLEGHFRNALGVDAEYVQLALLEAGLYHGAIDGAGVDEDQLSEISGHSLRVGAAQELMMRGLDISAIMRAGGWKTTDIVARYVQKAEHNVWE